MNETDERVPLWVTAIRLFVILFVIAGLVIIVNKQTAIRNRPVPLPQGWHHKLSGVSILDIVEMDGMIWVGGRDGLIVRDLDLNSLPRPPFRIPELEYVFDLHVDSQNNLWLAHDGGLTRWDGENLETWTENDGLPVNYVRSIGEAADGSIWVGTTDGAARFAGGIFENYTVDDGLDHHMVKVLFCDSRSSVWFGSYAAPYGGISILRDGNWQYFNTDNGLPHDNITSLTEDSDGAMWAGTGLVDRGGCAKFVLNGDVWEIELTLAESDGLSGNKVRSIYEDSTGAYWFGSEYTGVTRIRGDSVIIFDTRNGLSHNEVTCIMQDSNGNLLLGTLDGITRINASVLEGLD